METIYDTVKGEKTIVLKLYRHPLPKYADQHIHSNNQIHLSLACDEATARGVAAAIILDEDDNLAEVHASHIAIIKDGVFYMPLVKCCPPGVTRKVLLEICSVNDIKSQEEDINVERLFNADEVMIMGTMSGPIAITHVDDRPIGTGDIGPVTTTLKRLYVQSMKDEKNLYDIFKE